MRNYLIAVRNRIAAVLFVSGVAVASLASASVANADVFRPGWGGGCSWGQCQQQQPPFSWSMVAARSIYWGQGVRYDSPQGWSEYYMCPPNMPPGAYLTEWNNTVYWVAVY